MKQRRYTAKAKSRSASSKGRLATVNEDTTLLPFLFELLKEQSKSSVKSILANRQISVNGRTTTQFDTPLRSGDEVRISFQRGREDFSLESTLERQLNIYETILRRQSRKKGRRDGAQQDQGVVAGLHALVDEGAQAAQADHGGQHGKCAKQLLHCLLPRSSSANR